MSREIYKDIMGNNLVFISQIKRDGTGTTPVKPEYIKALEDETFHIFRLSMSERTFIASGFNSFVVRLKNNL